jgi:branched-chain amino acid transport system substrate-binding protein
MKSIKKGMICCAVVALLIPVMMAPAYAQQKANVVVKEWHIPTIYFLSGPMAGICESHKWLTETLIADINAAGGIAGKPIVTEFCDSALDPTKTAACVAKAIDAGALATNGPLNDMEMKASMPLVVRAGGPFSFSGTCTDAVAKQFFPWTIYSLAPTDDSLKYQMEMWRRHEPGIKSAVALEEPIYPMVHTLLVGFLKTFDEMKVKTNGIIQAPSGMADYTSVVVRAVGTGADAFLIGTTGPVAAKLVNGLVSRGVNPKHIYIEAGFVGPEFLAEARGNDEGVYSATSPNYAPTPAFAKYSKEYKDSHGGKPWGGLTPITYDMWYMIKAAIEHQGVTGDPAKLKEERIRIKDYAINQKDFHGLDATYDVVNGLATGYPQRLFQIHKDEALLVEELKPKH